MAEQAGSAGANFTSDWFSHVEPSWKLLFEKISPLSRVLEIGAYEGRATVWLLQNALAREGQIFCVDTWEGGVEHDHAGMPDVERRFNLNVSATGCAHQVQKVKARSAEALPALIANGGLGQFDLVYVDGSHQAPDVLTDVVLSYLLLRPRGLMICDDYLWAMEEMGQEDVLNSPKIALDAFTTIYRRKITLVALNHWQCCFVKR